MKIVEYLSDQMKLCLTVGAVKKCRIPLSEKEKLMYELNLYSEKVVKHNANKRYQNPR